MAILVVFFFFLHLLLLTSGVHYLPGDIAINCGSTGISTAFNGREWIGDIKPKSTPSLLIKGSSTSSSTVHNLVSADPVPYKTARISRTQFSYTFQVSPGQKLVRLHFSLSPYRRFHKLKDFFTVEAGPFTLLSNFSASLTADALGVKSFVKEYCINIEENQPLNIIFSPERSQSHETYAFINGIEVITMATDLYHSRNGDRGVQVVGHKYPIYIDNNTALEIMQRLNFRRDPILSIDNSGMFRMWATVLDNKANKINNFTWKTSVDVGFGYLVRLHFCENGNVMFSVLINDMIAETNVDIITERNGNGIIWYKDYMVVVKGHKEEGRRDLTISLQLKDEVISEVLKGLEICKLSNHDNSLASPNPSPPEGHSLSVTLQNLLSTFGHGNVIATGAVIIISLANIITYKLRKIWEANSTENGKMPLSLTERLCRPFSLSEIQIATENFNDALVIGKGGFGKVYKGFIEKGQQIVTIKRLKSNSKQGAHEFWTEVETLSKLRHGNLVSLIGYCNECQEMILLYEYIPSGTLADHLFGLGGESDCHSSLSWKQRLMICVGVGRGLDYLHSGTDCEIIHRDIKATNILLDEHLEAKISDFGLAKPQKKSQVQSYVSTNIKGTFGYFDPDYFRTRKLTRKSDTYAFGVVLLEVLCGRRALDRNAEEDKCNLTTWAQACISKGEVDQLVAPSLREKISQESLMTFLEVAKRCLHDEPKKRPSMAQVVVQLEFALEHQETSKSSVSEITSSDDVRSSMGETIQSISDEIQEMASIDEQNITPPPKERNKSEMVQIAEPSPRGTPLGKKKTNAYKLSRFWPWDAFWTRTKPSKKNHSSIAECLEANEDLHWFDWETIAAATNKFSPSNEIVTGTFGIVYKCILSTGQVVAVKMSISNSQQGLTELKNAVLLIFKFYPRNFTKILGYCCHREEIILVYEFMENKLDGHIFEYLEANEDLHRFDWETIATATNKFSPSNKIGFCSFGSVYKCILSTGQEVAVKRRTPHPLKDFTEMENEVLLISNLQHPNLIKLLGYCCHREENILVYEFMENKSLDAHIFDELRRRELGWTIRMKIIIGIARCLVYLHQDSGLRILHGDLQPRNILLDYEMKPKISDFGHARSLEEHQTETTSRIVGTYGHVSPEYCRDGVLSVKSDVYSFGVVVLEILSGRNINGPFPLIEHAWKMWNEGKALDLLDKSIEDEFSADKALSCIQVGLLCVQNQADDRPTMRSVLDMLEGEGVTLPQPKLAAFVSESRLEYSQYF